MKHSHLFFLLSLAPLALSSQNALTMDYGSRALEPAESVEWHDDAPATTPTPRGTSWRLPRISGKTLIGGLTFLMLCTCAAGEIAAPKSDKQKLEEFIHSSGVQSELENFEGTPHPTLPGCTKLCQEIMGMLVCHTECNGDTA